MSRSPLLPALMGSGLWVSTTDPYLLRARMFRVVICHPCGIILACFSTCFRRREDARVRSRCSLVIWFFAAAGASNRYKTRNYLIAVAVSRAVRNSAVGFAAHHYGRPIIRVLRHQAQYVLRAALLKQIVHRISW